MARAFVSHRFTTILLYSKTDLYKKGWTSLKKPYMAKHVEEYFVHDGRGWRTNYYGNVFTGPGIRGGESGKPWRGIDPTPKGRHWAIPGELFEDIDEDISKMKQHQKLDLLLEPGLIKIDPDQAWPMYERYLPERIAGSSSTMRIFSFIFPGRGWGLVGYDCRGDKRNRESSGRKAGSSSSQNFIESGAFFERRTPQTKPPLRRKAAV